MIEYNNYDKAIIVSGDGGFHCLIEYLHSVNKLEKVLTPNHKYSSLLRKFNSNNFMPYMVIYQPLYPKLFLIKPLKPKSLY